LQPCILQSATGGLRITHGRCRIVLHLLNKSEFAVLIKFNIYSLIAHKKQTGCILTRLIAKCLSANPDRGFGIAAAMSISYLHLYTGFKYNLPKVTIKFEK